MVCLNECGYRGENAGGGVAAWRLVYKFKNPAGHHGRLQKSTLLVQGLPFGAVARVARATCEPVQHVQSCADKLTYREFRKQKQAGYSTLGLFRRHRNSSNKRHIMAASASRNSRLVKLRTA
jgi:hypothetical protein